MWQSFKSGYKYRYKSNLNKGRVSLVVKNLLANVGVWGLIPGLRRSPGEGNGNSFQCSCVGNPMDRGTWWATVHGFTRVRHDLAT